MKNKQIGKETKVVMRGPNKSLLKRILIPFLVVMLLQAALVYGVIFESGPMEELKNNSFHIFNEKVSNRKNSLQSEMLGRWSDLNAVSGEIYSQVENVLEETGASMDSVTPNSESGRSILNNAASSLLETIRRNSVSGAFVIFEGQHEAKKCGLYFRDSDPSVNAADYSDLFAISAPAEVTKKFKIALESYWTPYFEVDSSDPTYNFYNRPYQEAVKNPGMSSEDLGYWSQPFSLNGSKNRDSEQVITYSMPLIMNGSPIGVIGIEISLNYLNEQMPNKELGSDDSGSYVIAVGETDENKKTPGEYQIISMSGARAKKIFQNEGTLKINSSVLDKSFYEIVLGVNRSKQYACLQKISLYNTHTPFENEEWYIIGVVSDQDLLSFFYTFKETIWVMLALMLMIGMAASIIVAKYVTNPITLLTRKLKLINPGQRFCLEEIQVAEIDELSATIQKLGNEVASNTDKMSAILEMTDTKMGACEYTRGFDNIICAGRFCELLKISSNENTITMNDAKKAIKRLISFRVKSEEEKGGGVHIFHVTEKEASYWLRLHAVWKQNKILMVVTEITKDMEEKLKLQQERDYDILTSLYNRRAFYEQMDKIFSDYTKIKQAAIMMMDLDNLKYVNDTYGHDYGDEYIKMAAKVLSGHENEHTVISRLSGDEFVIFIYGQSDQEQIQIVMESIFKDFKLAKIALPDQSAMQVRISGGLAMYPQDAVDYRQLIKFADFAMYNVKKTNKGRFALFNKESYNRDSYLLRCKEELNQLIEKELLSYMFQPIISIQDAKIFAYEALMRPMIGNIKSPLELLVLARAQSQLYEIERLTFFKSLEYYDRLDIDKEDCCLFINSIPNQCLDDKDVKFLEQRYKKYLSKIVMEITEEDKVDDSLMSKKKRYLNEWKAQIAIDDFGTGYNSEAILLTIHPDYIKIDRSLVEGIDQNESKQMLLKHLVAYSREQGIKTIAEGVETYEEMKVLIKCRIDYLQGFYLARPEYVPSALNEKIKNQIIELREN